MPSQITMPQLSDTMTEGTVVKWHTKEGDKVAAGQEIADIETDKATMPMETFDGGVLAYIAAAEGQKVKVGQVVAVVAVAGEDPAQVKQQAQAAVASAAPPPPAARQMRAGDVETDHPRAEQERAQSRQDQLALGTHPAPTAPVVPPLGERYGGTRMRVSPLAKRMAADQGVDLAQVRGSGPVGRIVQADVMSAASHPAAHLAAGPAAAATPRPMASAATLPPVLLSGQKEVIEMNKLRGAIAAALQRSKQTIPHFYESVDANMDAVVALRQRINQRLEKENLRLSIGDFVTKAVAMTLARHPALNARFSPEKNQITRYGDVNLGLAVAIADGLIVPVLRGVNLMGLREIRIRTIDLYDRARAQRLKREEQSEATFTISSLGSNGIRQFTAIINPPEVGILAVGAAEKRAVVKGDQIVAATMLTVTLSADHRVVDGATAAAFLSTLKELLEEPGMMLA